MDASPSQSPRSRTSPTRRDRSPPRNAASNTSNNSCLTPGPSKNSPSFSRTYGDVNSQRRSSAPGLIDASRPQHNNNRSIHEKRPHPLTSLTDVDFENFKLAKACGQAHLSSTPNGQVHPLWSDPSSSTTSTVSTSYHSSGPDSKFRFPLSQTPPPRSPPRAPHQDPHRLLSQLVPLLQRSHQDHRLLRSSDIVALHTQRHGVGHEPKGSAPGGPPSRPGDVKTSSRVFGVPLRRTPAQALSTSIVGGYQRNLPKVVFACVEELYRTGIYLNGLFRALPVRERHMQLVQDFDQAPHFGDELDLRFEGMPEICALLSTYMNSLPTPVLEPVLFEPFRIWCLEPSLRREEESRLKAERDESSGTATASSSSASPWNRSKSTSSRDLSPSEEDERTEIEIAQILFKLLPPPNLSLLVYLCAFFTQIPICPENGIQFEDMARCFAHPLLGGSSKRKAQLLLIWILRRWDGISEALLLREEAHVPGADAEIANKTASLDGLHHSTSNSSAPSSSPSPSRKSPDSDAVASKVRSSPPPVSQVHHPVITILDDDRTPIDDRDHAPNILVNPSFNDSNLELEEGLTSKGPPVLQLLPSEGFFEIEIDDSSNESDLSSRYSSDDDELPPSTSSSTSAPLLPSLSSSSSTSRNTLLDSLNALIRSKDDTISIQTVRLQETLRLLSETRRRVEELEAGAGAGPGPGLGSNLSVEVVLRMLKDTDIVPERLGKKTAGTEMGTGTGAGVSGWEEEKMVLEVERRALRDWKEVAEQDIKELKKQVDCLERGREEARQKLMDIKRAVGTL